MHFCSACVVDQHDRCAVDLYGMEPGNEDVKCSCSNTGHLHSRTRNRIITELGPLDTPITAPGEVAKYNGLGKAITAVMLHGAPAPNLNYYISERTGGTDRDYTPTRYPGDVEEALEYGANPALIDVEPDGSGSNMTGEG